MWELFAGWDWLPFQLIARQFVGINREQHHVIQIGVKAPMRRFKLMSSAEMDEALLLNERPRVER